MHSEKSSTATLPISPLKHMSSHHAFIPLTYTACLGKNLHLSLLSQVQLSREDLLESKSSASRLVLTADREVS
jgi:hypothetical protein